MTAARATQYELARRAFALPTETGADALVLDVALLYAGAVATAVAGALRRAGEAAHADVIAHLERSLAFAARERVLGIAWCTALGDCVDALKRDDLRHLARGVAVWCLESSSRGCAGRWRLALGGTTAPLLWDSLVLPPAESLAVDCDGRAATVEVTAEGRTRRLHLCRDAISGDWSGAGLEHVLTAGGGTEILLLPRRAVPSEEFPDLRPVMLEPVSREAASRIGATIELLRAQNAGYHGWVARAFRALFVVTSPEGRLVSGSLAGKPRFGYVSDVENTAGTAEMLIHEASHQHFHLAAKIGPVTTEDDDEARFYSPFVRTMRPLSRLLLAYHAFANVCSFYARAIADGIADSGACEQSLSSLRPDVDLVERTIDDNAALLTPLGAGLFEPLKERLFDARALAVH